MIRTCWQLAKHPELEARNLRRWAHMLGFGGHFLTKSRLYSTTFAELRDERAQHARAIAVAVDSVPEPDGETVAVINHWRYVGTGPLVVPALVISPETGGPTQSESSKEVDTS
jgi:hypothetical protein